MPYTRDGIPKINSYSLTDFHDFDDCPFRFFVRHHLDRKYEIDESSSAIALGNLLDQSIKRFHKENCYGTKSSVRLKRLVDDCAKEMRDLVVDAKLKGKHHFFESTIPFLTEEVINQAKETFINYYVTRKGDVKKSLGDVGFCQYIITTENGSFKLWGGPDTLEEGDDGIPEVVDYKSRQNIDKGKAYMDMDLMPKIYVLLCSQRLLESGHKKARFKVRYWQDPLDESFYEEFDLTTMNGAEFLFKQKIETILRITDFRMCNKKFCAACNSIKKDEFIAELMGKGYKVMTGETFLKDMDSVSDEIFSV